MRRRIPRHLDTSPHHLLKVLLLVDISDSNVEELFVVVNCDHRWALHLKVLKLENTIVSIPKLSHLALQIALLCIFIQIFVYLHK